MLTRRGFLGGLGALVGGLVLEEAIPFNRVWSFPKKIVIPPASLSQLATIYYNPASVIALRENFNYHAYNDAIHQIVSTELKGGRAMVVDNLPVPVLRGGRWT